MLEIHSKSSQNYKKVHFNPMCIRSRARKYTWIFWQNSVINFFLNVKWISLVFLCKITLHLGLKFSFFNLNMGRIPSKIVIKRTKIGLKFSRILCYVPFEFGGKLCLNFIRNPVKSMPKKGYFNPICIESRAWNSSGILPVFGTD